jgi:lipopolysaccharide biosynthesis protein
MSIDFLDPTTASNAWRQRVGVLEQISFNTAPGPNYAPDDPAQHLGHTPPVALIAYYLPQFHPIPENDAWWGKGFTEWTNVTKAVPRFKGHYQPRLPGELGFYDLRNKEIIVRQAALAKSYGVSGFCFHYYWFDGDRLLEAPLNLFLQNRDIDMKFCINWANENWTRRWSGDDRQILKAQRYSPESDMAFARSLEPLFRDPRYIRIDGRPLLLIYRPALLPCASETVARWREHFAAIGENPYIVMAQMDDVDDPRRYGMDAAAGFPPHRVGWTARFLPLETLDRFDAAFNENVVAYEAMMEAALNHHPTEFKLFPGVCPSWDNEARRPGKGSCFAGSSPRLYEDWLTGACRTVLARAETRDERIVFINAWNEWGEGAYLEPDRHYGYAYLAATANALRRVETGCDDTSSADGPEGVAGHNSMRQRIIRRLRRTAGVTADALEAAARFLRF